VIFETILLQKGEEHMKVKKLLKALKENSKNKGTYQIHLNSGNLEGRGNPNSGVEFSDLYFGEFRLLGDNSLICFDNTNRKPINKTEDGTDVYPMEIDNEVFIHINKIENIEELKEFEDWFTIPSTRVFNLYMYPENDSSDGNRDVVTIRFME
jgi:hypothetical protein